MPSNKEFEITYDTPVETPFDIDAEFATIAENRNPYLTERLDKAYALYHKAKASLEGILTGERVPVVKEKIYSYEHRALDMETMRRFDQSVTLGSLSTDVHNALGLPRQVDPESTTGSSSLTGRIDSITKASYKSLSNDYKRTASAEAKQALVGESNDSILNEAAYTIGTKKLDELDSYARTFLEAAEETTESKHVTDNPERSLGKGALRTIFGNKKRAAEEREAEERNRMLNDQKLDKAINDFNWQLFTNLNESNLFNEIQEEYNTQKRGVAEAIIDRAVEQFKQDMKSGTLIENFAHYVRGVLMSEGYLKDATNEQPRTKHRQTRMETSNGFDTNAVQSVDADITELQAQGYTIKKINSTLMRRYHPDLNHGDKSSEEKMKYFLSLGL